MNGLYQVDISQFKTLGELTSFRFQAQVGMHGLPGGVPKVPPDKW
jgi:hypothetical protein